MSDLVYNRTVSLSRASHANDATNGSRMAEVPYATSVPATIQPKRDRNVTPQNYPGAVSTESADSMTTWKILLNAPLSVLKGDIATDDLGVKYVVEISYPNPFGVYLEARITTP